MYALKRERERERGRMGEILFRVCWKSFAVLICLRRSENCIQQNQSDCQLRCYQLRLS